MSTETMRAVAAAPVTVVDAVDAYLAAYDGRDDTRSHRLGAWVRLLGSRALAEVSPEDIEEAIGKLAAEPARVYAGRDADGDAIYRAKRTGRRSGATLNRYLVAFGALFSWARRQRLVARTAVSPTKHVEKRVESRGRVRYLSDVERVRLLAACQGSAWPRLTLFVLMAITTGARRGELLGLRWRDVDLERGEAVLHDTKNGDRRVLVLIPRVTDELRRFKPKGTEESAALVFRSRLRPSQPYAVQKVFREAVATAGIRDFRLHDCRHCTASYLAQEGASLLEIADTLGHRTLRMVQRYAHLNTESRRRLIGRVFEAKL